MNNKQKAFLKEFNDLLNKYEVTITDHDNYDGEESYCGTDYEFVFRDADEVNYINIKDMVDGKFLKWIR